jgi:hypothetical protein
MAKPFASRRPPRPSWAWLALLTMLGVPGLVVLAQDDEGSTKAKGQNRPAAGKDAAKKDAAKASEKSGPEADAALKVDPQELWQDPLAEDLVDPAKFKPLPVPILQRDDTRAVRAMAQGQERVEPGTIRRYVAHHVGELTKRTNLLALVTPEGDPKAVKALEASSDELMRPLTYPMNAANAAFRAAYTKALLEFSREVLKNQLHARTMMMVVLSRTEDPQALPTFIAQLNDPNQALAVKLLAAVGITGLTQHGRRSLPVQQGVDAGRALWEFLKSETDAPWPLKFRVLEALGSLRLATANPLRGAAEFADAAMVALTDPEAKPDVRATAGWALGMMQVPSRVPDYNYSLVAHAIGRAAVAIGTRISQVPDRGTIQVNRLSVLLLELLDGLKGEPQVRDSGLTAAARSSPHRAAVAEVQRRVEVIVRAAIDLGRAAGVQKAARRETLNKAIADLKSYLASKPPTDLSLYKGGPAFALALEQVEVAPRPK